MICNTRITVGCDRNRMANLSKASNVVQEKYILYDVTGFTQKWHSIPVATTVLLAIFEFQEIQRGRPWGTTLHRITVPDISNLAAICVVA